MVRSKDHKLEVEGGRIFQQKNVKYSKEKTEYFLWFVLKKGQQSNSRFLLLLIKYSQIKHIKQLAYYY